jgi:hypothetical protein
VRETASGAGLEAAEAETALIRRMAALDGLYGLRRFNFEMD